MKRKSWLVIVGMVFSLCILAFQNCSKKNFSQIENREPVVILSDDEGPKEPTPEVPAPEEPTILEKSEDFKVSFNSQNAPLDMVWVIDNSKSMAAEAALVRDNLSSFLTALNKSSNFRFLLISGNSGDRGVTLPAGVDPATHLQIVKSVSSSNGPQILLDEVKKAPAHFFRADSKKVVVFVTDDDSNLSAMNFHVALDTSLKWVQSDVSVFSFIGIDETTSPCQAATGKTYKTLATMTSGHVYNICQTDWSSHFSDLTDSSLAMAIRRFTLKTTPQEIIDVKVDGQILASNLYKIMDKTLTLDDSVTLAENSMVVVRYK